MLTSVGISLLSLMVAYPLEADAYPPPRLASGDAGASLAKLAPTPPMGWNSWSCYGLTVREEEVKANADYMAEKLARHGWQYIVIDIRWSEPTMLLCGSSGSPMQVCHR